MSCAKRNTTLYSGTHTQPPWPSYWLVNNQNSLEFFRKSKYVSTYSCVCVCVCIYLYISNSWIFIHIRPHFRPHCRSVILHPVQPRVNVTLKSEGTAPSHYVIRGYGALINPKWFFRRWALQTHTSHLNFQRYSPFNSSVGPRQGKCARGHTPMEIFSH